MNESQIDTDLERSTSGMSDVAIREEHAVGNVNRGGTQTTSSAIIQLALDPAMTPERVEIIRMLREMQADEIARQNKIAFDQALAAYQPNKPLIKKTRNLEYPVDKNNPDGPKRLVSKFAKWDEDIDPVLTPLLARFGFTLHFDISPRTGDSGGLMVAAVLEHVQGHTRTYNPVPVPLDTSGGKNLAQSYGSTISYGQRYAAKIAGLIMLEGDDDDGVAAGGIPISFDEAAEIKKLVDEAGIGDALGADERKSVIVEWFNDMLGYALPKGYVSIRQEDSVRVRRALLSLKAKRLTSRQREVQI